MSTDDTDRPDPPTEEPLGAIPGYQLLRVLSRGGNNIVYEARQDGLNRIVALKIIRSANPRELFRLRAQADAVASVCHPNVVQIYEASEHAGKSILALEYVSGGTLADHLRDVGRMTAKSASLAIVGVARGLAAANAQQIVHGDLKPANILLDGDAEPKVANLGAGSQRGSAPVGNPAYVAPELLAGTATFLGPAADVWSLGVILYECITGRRPFAGDSSAELLHAICNVDPELPSQLVPELPRDLESVCLKCLAKNPAERYLSAAEVADDLARFLAGEPVSSRPLGLAAGFATWARQHKITAVLLAVTLLLTVVGLVGFTVTWQRAEAHLLASKEARMREEMQAAEALAARTHAEQVQTSERKRAEDAVTGHKAADRTLLELAGHSADLIVAMAEQDPKLQAGRGTQTALSETLASCKQAAASPLTTPQMRVRFSAAFVAAAKMCEDTNPDAAEGLLSDAVEVVRPAVAANPTDRQTVTQLTNALSQHAALLVKLRKPAAALPFAAEVVKLSQLGMAASEGEDRRFWKGSLALRSEALAEIYRKLGRRSDSAQALQDAKGQVQDADQFRLIAGDFALLAAAVPNPPNADEAKEKEAYLAEAIETLRLAVEAGWRYPSARTYKPSTIDNADFRPFQDHPDVKKLLAEAAKK